MKKNYYQKIKKQFNDLKFFIGDDSYLIIHTIINYHLLENEFINLGFVWNKK